MDALQAVMEKLGQLAASRMMAAWGVADLALARQLGGDPPTPVSDEFSRAVVFAFKLQRGVLSTVRSAPSTAYFHHYRQVNYHLDTTGLEAGSIIEEAGGKAIPIAASQIVGRRHHARQNPESDAPRGITYGHVSHRHLAVVAGMGWIGKNQLFVMPGNGCAVRLVTILTNMPLPAGKPAAGDCGYCTACGTRCPAQAVGAKKEDFNIDACWKRLNQNQHLDFVGQHICGACQAACRERWSS